MRPSARVWLALALGFGALLAVLRWLILETWWRLTRSRLGAEGSLGGPD